MTSSPHHRLLAPAEQSSETSRTEAAQALSQLQTQQPDIPLSTSSSGYTPLSSNHSFHSLPVTHGSSYSLGNVGPAIPVLPSPTSHWEHAAIRPRSSELALRSVKRNASPTELRSPRSRRDNESLLQLSTIPTPTSDQFKPGTHPHASKRAPSRARASPFVGSKTLSHGRDSQLGKRPPGRPRKSPVHPDDLGTSVGERVEDDGDAVTSTTSPNPRTAALEGAQARFPFHNTFMGSDSPEFRFTGPSLGSQDQVGASLAHNPSVVANPSFFGPRSTYDHPLSHTRSSAAHTPWSPSNPLSSSSSSLSYGSPGVPIPQPPYQILPAPKASASRQDPVHPSVEADGYMILRNAISPALVRDLVVFINTGLPVIAKSETAQTYAAPIQAYKVRDEFVLKWRDALRPFYEAMGKSIPKMPRESFIGSFMASDVRNTIHSLLHVGNKNELNVTIALSSLSPENGFFRILRGSHRTKHPARTRVDDWNQTPIVLEEGDAVIWRGDLHYLLSSKGGGHYQALVFDWGPGTIDLTK